MKTFRYVTREINIDITMPTWIFWFFKKYARFKSSKTDPINGVSLDVVIFDEAAQ